MRVRALSLRALVAFHRRHFHPHPSPHTHTLTSSSYVRAAPAWSPVVASTRATPSSAGRLAASAATAARKWVAAASVSPE